MLDGIRNGCDMKRGCEIPLSRFWCDITSYFGTVVSLYGLLVGFSWPHLGLRCWRLISLFCGLISWPVSRYWALQYSFYGVCSLELLLHLFTVVLATYTWSNDVFGLVLLPVWISEVVMHFRGVCDEFWWFYNGEFGFVKFWMNRNFLDERFWNRFSSGTLPRFVGCRVKRETQCGIWLSLWNLQFVKSNAVSGASWSRVLLVSSAIRFAFGASQFSGRNSHQMCGMTEWKAHLWKMSLSTMRDYITGSTVERWEA